MTKLSCVIAIFLATTAIAFADAPPQCTLPTKCECGGACGCPTCDCFGCEHTKQVVQKQQDPLKVAKRSAKMLEWPVLIWRNYDSPFIKESLDGAFIHYKTQDRNEFGGGRGVTIAYLKDGWLYSTPSLRISATSCSAKTIRDAWAEHKGTYANRKGTTYQSSPSMMGGYRGGMMMSAPTRRFSFRGAGCST